MDAIQQAIDCLKNGNRTWEAMDHLVQALKQYKETEEVPRQLRAEREALTLQVEEQRMLLEQARYALSAYVQLPTDRWPGPPTSCLAAITQHLKGKE